jgi:succinoglycan biosynthesis transport protein ExoP
MQPTETFNVSRRTLDVEDYIDILRRHKGWIFGPFLFTLVASVVGGYLWPDTYISTGIIKVEPQQLPTALVQQVMTQDIWDSINSMLENIESRSSLTQIVTTDNLYLKERARLPLEDVLAEMRKRIAIEPKGTQAGGHQVPAFAVSFSYPDRHLAQRVVQELIGKFIDENSHNLSTLAFESTQFMQDQADSSRKELEAVETQLSAYKSENNGRLPEQVTTNYQKLTTLETSAGNINAQIGRLEGEKLMLESNLQLFTKQADERARVKADPVVAAQQQQQQKSVRLAKAEQEVETWTNNLQVLQQRYQDTYPDVKSAKEFLKAAEAKRDAIAKDESENAKKEIIAGKPIQTPVSVKEQQEQEATISHYQMSIGSDDTQIEDLKGQLKRVNGDITTLQARLNSAPQSEKEYEDLLREKDLKREKYEEMTKNLAKAQVQQDMENKQEGERLEILDPASLPDSPSEPRRPVIIAIGAGIGLMLGIVIAGAREMKDTSLKNLKDVRAYTQMAILGSIPLLENDFVVRRRRRLAWLGWTTACLAAVVLMSGSVVYYFSTKQ